MQDCATTSALFDRQGLLTPVINGCGFTAFSKAAILSKIVRASIQQQQQQKQDCRGRHEKEAETCDRTSALEHGPNGHPEPLSGVRTVTELVRQLRWLRSVHRLQASVVLNSEKSHICIRVCFCCCSSSSCVCLRVCLWLWVDSVRGELAGAKRSKRENHYPEREGVTVRWM